MLLRFSKINPQKWIFHNFSPWCLLYYYYYSIFDLHQSAHHVAELQRLALCQIVQHRLQATSLDVQHLKFFFLQNFVKKNFFCSTHLKHFLQLAGLHVQQSAPVEEIHEAVVVEVRLLEPVAHRLRVRFDAEFLKHNKKFFKKNFFLLPEVDRSAVSKKKKNNFTTWSRSISSSSLIRLSTRFSLIR